jgi:hypothetical protein
MRWILLATLALLIVSCGHPLRRVADWFWPDTPAPWERIDGNFTYPLEGEPAALLTAEEAAAIKAAHDRTWDESFHTYQGRIRVGVTRIRRNLGLSTSMQDSDYVAAFDESLAIANNLCTLYYDRMAPGRKLILAWHEMLAVVCPFDRGGLNPAIEPSWYEEWLSRRLKELQRDKWEYAAVTRDNFSNIGECREWAHAQADARNDRELRGSEYLCYAGRLRNLFGFSVYRTATE